MRAWGPAKRSGVGLRLVAGDTARAAAETHRPFMGETAQTGRGGWGASKQVQCGHQTLDDGQTPAAGWHACPQTEKPWEEILEGKIRKGVGRGYADRTKETDL